MVMDMPGSSLGSTLGVAVSYLRAQAPAQLIILPYRHASIWQTRVMQAWQLLHACSICLAQQGALM
jgi:hypothetical protein